MKGDPKVLELLNESLTAELTAINQYFVHAEICENHGFEALYEAIRAESIEEMRHAEKLIERILFLEGQPNMSRMGEIKIGKKVEEMLASDLKLEKEAVQQLNRAIGVCGELADNGSRELLKSILLDEEKHVSFIETQLALIEKIGLTNYLSQQIGKHDE